MGRQQTSTNRYSKEYTKPQLRQKLKDKIKDEDKGARKGQWSARKSQLLSKEYEKQGGSYRHKNKLSKPQKDLRQWSEQEWQTSDHKKAVRGKKTARYLPKKAWDKLSSEERSQAEGSKYRASHKQYVPNTEATKQVMRALHKKKSKGKGKVRAPKKEIIPPQSVANNAAKGLALHKELGRGGTAVGLTRARQLMNRQHVSPTTITRMVSYFARHGVDRKAAHFADEVNPSNGYIAWLLWGGDEGHAWAKKIKQELSAHKSAS